MVGEVRSSGVKGGPRASKVKARVGETAAVPGVGISVGVSARTRNRTGVGCCTGLSMQAFAL